MTIIGCSVYQVDVGWQWDLLPSDCKSALGIASWSPNSHFGNPVSRVSDIQSSLSIWSCCGKLTCSKTYRIPLFSLIWECQTWFKASCHGRAWVPPLCTQIKTRPPSTCSPWKPRTPAREKRLILLWAHDTSPFSQWNVLCKCWLTSLVSIKQLNEPAPL